MKKIKLLAIAAMVIVAGALLFTNENLVKAEEKKDTIIKDGVYIGGIDVSGMTAEEATAVVDETVGYCLDRGITDWGKLKSSIRDSLGDFVWKKTKRRPMILPIIMEV